MKKLLLSLVAFLVALTFGCQEYAVTGPEELSGNTERVVSGSEGTTFKNYQPPNKGVININSNLKDPVLNVSVLLVGKIAFDHSTFNQITTQINGKKIVRLELKIEAELINRFGRVDREMKIAEKSSHKFEFRDDRIFSLKITYRITNRKNVKLQVTYPVTADGLEQPTFNLIRLFAGLTAN